jgi:intergrase/recombinase
MAIPVSTIKTELRRWVQNASGFTSTRVIFAYENAPQDAGAYIHIWPTLSITPIACVDETNEVNSSGNVVTKAYRRVIAYIQCFGTGANATMSAIQDALNRPAPLQYFIDADLAVNIESIQDQTALKGRNYEERARMEVSILCGSEVTDDLGYFTHISYESDDFEIPETTIPN